MPLGPVSKQGFSIGGPPGCVGRFLLGPDYLPVLA